jgi:predicted transcriptional regulator
MTNKGKMIEAIYAACLTKRATLVIFYLINRANQELTCFPSVGTIARECNMSTRTVQRALNDLEEAGFLERESRFHERGGQKSSLYHINEKIVVDRIEEVDYDNMNTNLEVEDKKETVVKVGDATSECFDEINQETSNSVLNILLRKIKKGFFHIVSWGL